MPAKPKKADSWRKALPRRLADLQRTAQRETRKRWDEMTDLLPPAPRRALKRLTTNVERAGQDLRKRSDRAVSEARKRAERLADEVQKRFEGTIQPFMSRMDVASRKDLDRLHKRLHELERRLEHPRHQSSAHV